MGNCLICCNLPGNTTPQKVHHLLQSASSIHSPGMGQGVSVSADRHGNWGKTNVMGGSSGQVLASDYELGQRLASGQFGVIRLCTSRHSGERFACKSIQKSRLWSAGDVEDVRREVQVMKLVTGHPNIVELKAVYEDEECVHLVMELCAGGELFDYITENKEFSEHEAAGVCVTLMEVLKHCHSRGVIHRDLKPENILLSKSKTLFPVKVADFGLAVHTHKGEKLSGMAGSAYYIAPEVLEGDYGKEIDVWSAGVVLYILLSGVPPFWSESEEGVFDAIRGGQLDLASSPWPSLSSEVKDLLTGMLCPDAKRRYTPEQVLNHGWIKRHSGSAETNVFSKESSCSTDDSKLSSEGEIFHTPVAEGSSETLADFLPDSKQSFKLQSYDISLKDSDDSIRCVPISSVKSALENQHLGWSSLTANPASSHGDHMATVGCSIEDTAQSSFQQSIPHKIQESNTITTIRSSWERERVVADTAEGKCVIVQEKERGGMGWKKIREEKDEESPINIGCELGRLLFSSSPTSIPSHPNPCIPQVC